MGTVRALPRWSRATFAVGLALVALCVAVVAADPTAPSYEFSIFQAYPLAFWAGLVAAVLLGQVLILRNAFEPDAEYWKLGAVLVGVVNVVLLALPHVRYTLYGRGDVLTHVGFVRRILETGAIMETNYYPAIHVLSAQVAELTALAPKDAISLLPVVFSVVYLASTVYLLDRLTPSPVAFLVALSVGVLPLLGTGHVYAAPSAVSFLLVPLVVYLYLRLYDGEWFRTYAVAFVLVVLTLVPFHPLTFLYLLAVLLSLRMAYAAAIRSDRFRLEVPGAIRSPTLLLGVVLFLWWYSSFTTTITTGLNVLGTVFGRAGGGRFAHLADVTAEYSPSVVDVLTIGVARFGMLGLLAGGAALLTAWYLLGSLRRDSPIESRVLALGAVFGVFLSLATVAFFVDLVFGYHRFARPVYLTAPALFGIGLWFADRHVDRRRARQVGVGILAVCLVALVVLTVLNLHLSPITRDTNKQVTAMEVEGSDWFFEHREEALFADELGFNQFRFYSLSAEEVTREEPYDIVLLARERNVRHGGTAPPDHFGYDENDTAAAAYDDDRYVLLTEMGRDKYEELYPGYEPLWRFSPGDFRRLERDPAVDHVYDNGEFDVYYVHGS